MTKKTKLGLMSDDEILGKYKKHANNIIHNSIPSQGLARYSFIANMYKTEIQRRENQKTNKIMRNWTIAIGIMTFIMLIATVINVLIAVV